jgi:hypothetical protein
MRVGSGSEASVAGAASDGGSGTVSPFVVASLRGGSAGVALAGGSVMVAS